ncbi:uncharacterized protein [Typha latifolia]|uniref:uncharacterized protein isoform X1 n=1 Tax=Typha latifolia TaxID=4733 RepID=UPI003C2F5D01
MAKSKAREATEEILETLGDFTSKENWDKFFTLRGAGDSFEWYAEWPELRDTLFSQLPSSSSTSPIQILVPGCGSSRLSEHVYDAGFKHITNVDFSKVIVSDMLRRYVRSRPEMRWRVMDMTELQFADESFDVILDKGGLDALMEPELGPQLGSKYLKEVKRVLKSGGKFLCLTLAESHVLGLLFSEFRFGWESSVHAIPHKPSNNSSFQTFMVSMVKQKLGAINSIKASFDCSSVNCNAKQVYATVKAVENENNIRNQYSSGDDILYSLQDLQLGAVGSVKELLPGRRCHLILGEEGTSVYGYKAVLLDARQQSEPYLYHCGIFLVPKTRAHEWLFTSEEGQWCIVESSKAARLILVFLDSSHALASMDVIQKDLSPLVKNLAPGETEDTAQIPFMMANDGIKERNIVRKVTSPVTGPIVVEDVIYENASGDEASLAPSDIKIFRRLTFERSLGLVQSEALLTRDSASSPNKDKKKNSSLPKSSKKRGKKKNDSGTLLDGPKGDLKINHSSLASSYHSGIISGFALVASSLDIASLSGEKVKTIIIGLGAGLLPMFLHKCLPFLEIEVAELDPIILDLAREYFNFAEDKQLKVHVGDGIKYIQDNNMVGYSEDTKNEENIPKSNELTDDGSKTNCAANGSKSSRLKILIIDADSSDLSSGLTCPPADFVEETFLLSARDFLSQGGLFIINLVSRSSTIREMVVSRLKTVFHHLFSLQLEEDVNEVLIASPMGTSIDIDRFPESVAKLQNLMKFPVADTEIDLKRLQCLQ